MEADCTLRIALLSTLHTVFVLRQRPRIRRPTGALRSEDIAVSRETLVDTTAGADPGPYGRRRSQVQVSDPTDITDVISSLLAEIPQ